MLIIPLNLTQPLAQLTPRPAPAAGRSLRAVAAEFNVIGGQGVGNRARYRHHQRMGGAGFHQRDRNELGLRAPVHLGYIDTWRER